MSQICRFFRIPALDICYTTRTDDCTEADMSEVKREARKRQHRVEVYYRRMAEQREKKHLLGTSRTADRMIEFYQDVLQNIEFALVSACRDNRDVDDAVLADALAAAILGRPCENPRADKAFALLSDVRAFRSDVPDETWRSCLQTVLQSIHRHSSRRPGCRAYINFVSPFVA